MHQPNLATMTLDSNKQGYIFGKERLKEIEQLVKDEHIKQLLPLLGRQGENFIEYGLELEDNQRQAAYNMIKEFAGMYPDRGFEKVGFALVASKTPNAFAIHSNIDKSYAIGFDHDVHNLGTMLFIAAHWACLTGQVDFFVQALIDLVKMMFFNTPASEEFEKAWLLFYRATRQEYQRLGDEVGSMTVRFLLGHELGHIYLGHFDKGNGPLVQLDAEGDRKDEISAFNYALEFAADAWSAKALMELSQQGVYQQIIARTVPAAYMSIIAIIEDLYKPKTDVGHLIANTHPPAWERAVRLKEIGALANALPLPEAFEVLFRLPDFVNSIRSSLKFQEIAGQFHRHFAVGE